jgi:hypothetical protein
VRARLGLFTTSYVTDWENWLKTVEPDRTARFASILTRRSRNQTGFAS